MKRIQALPLLMLTGMLSACGGNEVQVTDAKPTISLSAAPTTITEAGTVKLTADAKDDKGISKVEFYRGSTKIGEDTTAPFEATDNVTEAQNGTVTYRAVATDTASQTAEASAAVTVNVNVAPTISLTLSATQLTNPGTVTATASASDANGIAKVEFYLDGVLKQTVTATPYSANFTFTFLDTYTQNGLHTIKAIAYDTTGKTADASQTVQVGIEQASGNISIATAALINIGQTVTGRIAGEARNVDYYRFNGAAGDRLRLKVLSQSYDPSSTLDPYVTVYMPDGKTVLEKDDDSGLGMESDLRFDLPVNGTYYIAVTSYKIYSEPDESDNLFSNTYRLDLLRR